MTKQATKAYEINPPKPGTIINIRRGVVLASELKGPGYYRDTVKAMHNPEARLTPSNGERVAYLLETAYHDLAGQETEPDLQNVRDVMENNYLWLAERKLWVPGENPGVYVVADPKGIGLSKSLDPDELEQRLKGSRQLKNGVRFSRDRTVAFAPKESYVNGEVDAKDGVLVASMGTKGAQSFIRTGRSKHFQEPPASWIVEPDSEPIQTLSAVGDFGGRLSLDGSCDDDYRDGYASGVFD
jgi:hypothetical protein